MKLLLLLSALLSAIGGSGAVRAASTPVTLSRGIAQAVQAAATTQARVAARPLRIVAGPAGAILALPTAWSLAPALPIYAARRRE